MPLGTTRQQSLPKAMLPPAKPASDLYTLLAGGPEAVPGGGVGRTCRRWSLRTALALAMFAAGACVGAMAMKATEPIPSPADESPYEFVCHDGETNVPLETSCERINEINGAAGARRRLTSVETAYSCLPHYRLRVPVVKGGEDGEDAGRYVTFPYHAEAEIEKPDARFTMAIILVHGAYRDADNYFCLMYGLHKRVSHRSDDEVLVITPDFNYENDEGARPGDAFWNRSRPFVTGARERTLRRRAASATPSRRTTCSTRSSSSSRARRSSPRWT